MRTGGSSHASNNPTLRYIDTRFCGSSFECPLVTQIRSAIFIPKNDFAYPLFLILGYQTARRRTRRPGLLLRLTSKVEGPSRYRSSAGYIAAVEILSIPRPSSRWQSLAKSTRTYDRVGKAEDTRSTEARSDRRRTWPPKAVWHRMQQQVQRQATQAQVDEVVDIMKTNVEKVLERDQKLSELDDRADALQQGASQFEQQAGKLKRKFWLQNLKMMIIMGVIGLIVLAIIVAKFMPESAPVASPGYGYPQGPMAGPPGMVVPGAPGGAPQAAAPANPPAAGAPANGPQTAGAALVSNFDGVHSVM
ncbi:hypothetical protein KM043_011885 [Ampulex compressa]|nr:hypothetical protein KM043_011885 [Ampulex compressa]